MELSVIENDHTQVKDYLENFVPDNYYQVLGDAYLYQVRAVLLHAVSNPGQYNVRYDNLINGVTVQFEENRSELSREIERWSDLQTINGVLINDNKVAIETLNTKVANFNGSTASSIEIVNGIVDSLEAQLNDYEFGGVNLIYNSTFDKGYLEVGTVNTTVTDYVLNDLYRCTNTGTETDIFGIGSLPEFSKIKLMEGRKYTLSFYGFSSETGLNAISLYKEGQEFTLPSIAMDNDITNHKKITFIAPFTGDDIGINIAATGYPEGSWFSVVNIQLELGTRATDWKPSPFDENAYVARVAGSIETLQQIVLENNNSLIQNMQTMAANVAANRGTITANEVIEADRYTTTIAALNSLTAKTESNTASIISKDQVYTTRFDATATKLDAIELSMGQSSAAITRLDEAIITNRDAAVISTENLNAKLDGLKVGGRNLIRNSDYKSGYRDWGSVTTEKVETALGTSITCTSTDTGQFGIENEAIYSTIDLVAGSEYTLSMYVAGDIASINAIYIRSEGNDPQIVEPILIAGNLSERKSVTFTSSITIDNANVLVAASGYPIGSWFKFTAIQLERGNVATDYTLAAEDIIDFIDSVEANIEEYKEVQVDAYKAQTDLITALDSKFEDNKSLVENSISTVSTATVANAQEITKLSSTVSDNAANITTITSTLTTIDDSIAQSRTQITTEYGEAINNAITTEQQARSTEIGSIASSVSSLETTVDGNTAKISTSQSSIDGLKATSSEFLTVGGKIAGWKTSNDGYYSDFEVTTDSFKVGNGTVSKAPFSILGNDIVFNGKVSFNSVTGNIAAEQIPDGTLNLDKFITDDKDKINTASTNATTALQESSAATASIDTLKSNVYFPNTTEINGGNIRTNTIDADKINVTELSTISANIGHFKSAETGARFEIQDSLLSVYDENNILRVRLGLW